MNLPHTNLQYADDLVLWSSGNTFEIAQSNLQKSLFQFEKFSQHSDLPIAPTKSKIIQFHRKRNHVNAKLTLNKTTIPEDNHINYLGLMLDQKLNFHLHISNTIKKCYRKANILKRLLSTPWGCKEKTLLQFYKSHIRPHIDYGLIVYGACAKTQMQKIETTQNDIIRLIFGLRKPTSTKFLLMESGLTTIRERRRFLLTKHLTKIESNSSHTLHNWLRNPAMYRGIADEYANIQKKFPVPAKSIAHTFPQSPPWNWSIPIINTDFSKWTKDLTPIAFVQKKFAELNTITYKNHFQIFVDGSKMNEKVASGVFLPHLKIAMGERLFNNLSIMSAELNAIIMALEHLKQNQSLIENSNNIIIYSDSLSSLELLASAPQYKLDIDTYHCLSIIDNLASSGIKTYFQYIPSHSGISGNHQVDEIAKNAINIDQPSGRPIPIRDIYRWRLSDINFNKINPTLSPFPNKYLSKIYHRIRSGTNGLNFLAFSYKLSNSSGSIPLSPLCRHCNMNNETIDHCLFECNMLTSAQHTLLSKLLKYFKHHKIPLSAKSLANYTCTQSIEIDIYHLIFELLESKDLLKDI